MDKAPQAQHDTHLELRVGPPRHLRAHGRPFKYGQLAAEVG
jgi:hypothetical protein